MFAYPHVSMPDNSKLHIEPDLLDNDPRRLIYQNRFDQCHWMFRYS